ncbi:dioxygenase, partial [Raoultella ornithinolytica]|uniref:dioxygenase n=1 Tax=Raoultella ornithinolytica TaxID=54291 RepID=UPI0030D99A70
AEFLAACDYLARAGQTSNDKRQEFILLGDILGVEVLVDMITHPVDGPESESTVLGPFYRENPPILPKGAST